MDRLALIQTPIASELELFKTLFNDSLVTENDLLNNAVAHIRRKEGKMMRPMLLFLSAKLFGEVSSETYHTAVSLELLHTASLVHDDVVDESVERRGQLSVNAMYNNKVAVLVGDYMLASSLLQVSRTGNSPIIETIAALGQSLSDGELLQLSNIRNPHFSEAVYLDVIAKKTAVLFAACAATGAMSVYAADHEVALARRLGELIGICFQIRDDIFDYFDKQDIGKPTGNDMTEGKLTLPAIYVLNKTGDAAACAIAQKVKNGTAVPDEIARLIAFTKENGGIEYATEVMLRYKAEALQLLEPLPDSEAKAALKVYLDYLIEREK
ncbi:MAG: polyprenyl synthetase family protein [Prevotellaceae bacterium]|jgi:octaprenyl-diphosphate synthase|nr:polyprenyl synthetase family protein [Prevotellaceae bacterium]